MAGIGTSSTQHISPTLEHPTPRIHTSLRLGSASSPKKKASKGKQATKVVPPSSKAEGKRRVTRAPIKPRLVKSPLQGASLRKCNSTRGKTASRRKLNVTAMENVAALPCSKNKFSVPPQGLSGGLALFWKDSVELSVLSSSLNYIDTSLTYHGKLSNITLIYGEPQQDLRNVFWDNLSLLFAERDTTWLITGDLNDLLDNSEKRGGPSRCESSFIPFRNFVSMNGLLDLQHSGNSLSWRGARHHHFIRCRLDRSLANCSWHESFPSGRCKYLRYEGSDNRPVISFFDESMKKKKGLFRFDRRIIEDEEARKVIEAAWATAPSDSFLAKLNRVRRDLIAWTKEKRVNSGQIIKDYQMKLETALSADTPIQLRIDEFKAVLEKLYKITEALSPSISQDSNEMLIAIPENEEIWAAVLDIHKDKAPGPDGFSAGFYHAYWDIVGETVSRDIRSPNSASHGWRSILAGRDILRKGLGWSVGDGSSIHVWSAPWLSTLESSTPIGLPTAANSSLMVKDLISPITNDWNLAAIRLHLPQYEVPIRNLILSSHKTKDALVWLPDKSGLYSTKSGYSLAKLNSQNLVIENFNWQSYIWKVPTAPKIRMLMWKLMVKALPLGSTLATRGLGDSISCKLCGGLEDATHLLLSCLFAAKVWDLAPKPPLF
ncbi:unnamed protein product [Arabidopsis halleri]